MKITMKIGTIDRQNRIRLVGSHPRERFWIINEPDGYRLKRVPEPRRMTKQEVLKALRNSRLVFKRDWEAIRGDTREP